MHSLDNCDNVLDCNAASKVATLIHVHVFVSVFIVWETERKPLILDKLTLCPGVLCQMYYSCSSTWDYLDSLSHFLFTGHMVQLAPIIVLVPCMNIHGRAIE